MTTSRVCCNLFRMVEWFRGLCDPGEEPKQSNGKYTLRIGAAWEVHSIELSAKAHERLKCAGDLLDEIASTMF